MQSVSAHPEAAPIVGLKWFCTVPQGDQFVEAVFGGLSVCKCVDFFHISCFPKVIRGGATVNAPELRMLCITLSVQTAEDRRIIRNNPCYLSIFKFVDYGT